MATCARVAALAFGFALVSARAGFAQSDAANPWFTRIGFSPAYVVAIDPFDSIVAPGASHVDSVPTVTIEWGRQTDGSREWHHLYGLPAYGVGLSIASPGAGATVPRDAYTFFSWPFARPSERVQLTTDFGMGLSWNWKAFDPRTNSYTTVLGSNLNARIDWGFYLRYLATAHSSVYAGVDFTHRSNGGMRQPDQGINVIGPSVALRYDFAPARAPLAPEETTAFSPTWEFVVGSAGGAKNVLDERNGLRRDFGAFNATAALQRHFYRYGKIAVGNDVIYDGSIGARIALRDGVTVDERAPFGDRFALGLYGGYEHVIGRFGAIVQVGRRLVNSSGDPNAPRLYERYGWRYQFSDLFWGTFAVRAVENRKADALEVGVGYRIRWPPGS
jgi:lipid A 3-O-deacylase PagL